NLTLHDWLTVFMYVDEHPDLPQEWVVAHFNSWPEGMLKFTQATLYWKLKKREKLEAQVQSHSDALSRKRPRTVTCPEVEWALVLWVCHMEEKGEVVNGPMLQEK
ncbi:hypothetical protein EDD15DRAFT_2173185, partial [Pisolithus albus]